MILNNKVSILGVVSILLYSLHCFSFALDKPLSNKPEAQALVDKAWAMRGGEKSSEDLDKIIKYLEEAQNLDPANDTVLVALSMYYFKRGSWEQRAGDQDTKAGRPFFEKGYKAAERALALRESSWAHYFAANNLGSMRTYDSILYQAVSFPRIRSHIEWIGRKDRTFHHGAYARFWCDAHTSAPRQIIDAVGLELDQVCMEIENAIVREPRFLENYYYRIKCCVQEDDQDKTLDIVEIALRIEPESYQEELGSNLVYRERFLKLWREKTGKEYPGKK